MRLIKRDEVDRNTSFEVFGDECSENVLLSVGILDYYINDRPCYVFIIYTTGYGGETGIEYLGKFKYNDVVKAIKETKSRFHLDVALDKLERLDNED